MRRQSRCWGVFVSRFHDALDRFRRRRLSADEAAQCLAIGSVRLQPDVRLGLILRVEGLVTAAWQGLVAPSDPAETGGC